MEQKKQFSDGAMTDNMISILKEDSFYEFLSLEDAEIICEIFAELRKACGCSGETLVPMDEFNEYFAYEAPIVIAEMFNHSDYFDSNADYFVINDFHDFLETWDSDDVYYELKNNVDKDMLEEMPLLRSLMKTFYDNSGKDETCSTAFEG